jgi:hypothetical protein
LWRVFEDEQMDYLNQIASHYEGLINVVGSLFGIAGVIFGAWRYFRERSVREELREKQQELDAALSRLQHLDDYTEGLKKYGRRSVA